MRLLAPVALWGQTMRGGDEMTMVPMRREEDEKQFWVKVILMLGIHLITLLLAALIMFNGVDKRLAVVEAQTRSGATKEYVDGLMNGSAEDRRALHAALQQLSAEVQRLQDNERYGYDPTEPAPKARRR